MQEAIFNYFDIAYAGKNLNSSVSRPLVPLMASYLMFLDMADHSNLKEQLRDLNLTHYITEISQEALEYVKSLPKVLYTMHMYEEDEYVLLRNFDFYYENAMEYKLIFDHVVKYINEKYPRYKVMI
jgi:hypothetical protein